MPIELVLDGNRISYTVRYSSRSRNIRITIHPDRGLVVTAPGRAYERLVDGFLRQKSSWILKHLNTISKQNEDKIVIKYSKQEYERNKASVLKSVSDRVKFFNSLYGFRYKRISIRNQTSLWGSCSASGNLQFNYKLMYLPDRTRDYIVVHELCHLQEHNHGPSFWKLVAKVIPDYKTIRASLRQYVMKEG